MPHLHLTNVIKTPTKKCLLRICETSAKFSKPPVLRLAPITSTYSAQPTPPPHTPPPRNICASESHQQSLFHLHHPPSTIRTVGRPSQFILCQHGSGRGVAPHCAGDFLPGHPFPVCPSSAAPPSLRPSGGVSPRSVSGGGFCSTLWGNHTRLRLCSVIVVSPTFLRTFLYI